MQKGSVDAVLTVRDVMTTEVVSVNDATPLKDVATVLIDKGISGVPVVDDSGHVVGVVSEGDFLFKESGPGVAREHRLARFFGGSKSALARAKLEATTAGEAMTSPAITIRASQPVAEAARQMTAQHVNRLVVLEGDDLIGIVTRADLVRAFVRTDEELVDVIKQEVLLRILWLDPAGFDVHVKRGVAMISGHAERRSTAEAVRSSVAMVPGIVRVDANIGWSLDDAEIRPATVDAFFPYSSK
jgi:CBS domain-containing protein